MAAWLYEEGIGENRAILVEQGVILEAAIEWPGAVRAGAVEEGRLTAILVPGRRGIVTLASGAEALIEPLPARVTEGARLRVEVVREAIPESGRDKIARVRAADAPPCAGPSLRERIGSPEALRFGEDAFEAAGWTELLDEATSGEIGFPGGNLRMSLTPAMTLFDVDGALDPAALAVVGAAAAGRAIRRFGIGGSIGIDLPTLPGKADRTAAAEALDRALPQPFERTAVNGFGFLQIVRRRVRPSIPELLRADPAGAAARALLRRAERVVGGGPVTFIAAPSVIERIEREPGWRDALARRTGGEIGLQVDERAPIFGGHVHHRPL